MFDYLKGEIGWNGQEEQAALYCCCVW
jgi:hypothetical protein